MEKIHIAKCPICGGKMKYYNKPVEWREVMHSDGSIKREVIRKIPALECKRNHEHFLESILRKTKSNDYVRSHSLNFICKD